MGTFKTTVEVGDPQGGRYRPLEATVDTGATYTMIPADVLQDLAVSILERRSFELADGRLADYDVGETKIRIDGRTVTSLVVFGDARGAPVLGAYTLEGLGLAVDPVRRRLVPVRGLLLRAWRSRQQRIPD